MRQSPEKSKRGFVNVEDDRFWSWRVDREENHLVQLMTQEQENKANVERLKKGIKKAKEVAARFRNRPVNKETSTN